jgi:putative transposase
MFLSFGYNEVATIKETGGQLDGEVSQFKNRQLEAVYPFVIVDAKYLRVREDHRIVSKAFMVAMGIAIDGQREIIGFDTYENESGHDSSDAAERLIYTQIRT